MTFYLLHQREKMPYHDVVVNLLGFRSTRGEYYSQL